MPSIYKIRLAGVEFCADTKRRVYPDTILSFCGESGLVIMPNGGGKTTLIQFVLQTLYPNLPMKEPLENRLKSPDTAHIAVEWLDDDQRGQTFITAITFKRTGETSGAMFRHYQFVMPCSKGHHIEDLPFTFEKDGVAYCTRADDIINSYYKPMENKIPNAKLFGKSSLLKEYFSYLDEKFHFTQEEILDICKINKGEGNDGMNAFFKSCTTETLLTNNIILPTIKGNFDQGLKLFRDHRQVISDLHIFRQKIQKTDQYLQAFDTIEKIETTFFRSQDELRHTLGKLRSIYRFVSEQTHGYEQKGGQLVDEKNRLETESFRLKQENAALWFFLGEKEADVAKSILQLRKQELSCAQMKLADYQSYFFNTQVLGLQNKKAILEQELERLKRNRDLEMQELSLDEWKDKIHQNACMLHFRFQQEIQSLSDQRDACKEALRSAKAAGNALGKEESELKQRIEKNMRAYLACEGKIERGEKDRDELLASSRCSSIEKADERITFCEKVKKEHEAASANFLQKLKEKEQAIEDGKASERRLSIEQSAAKANKEHAEAYLQNVQDASNKIMPLLHLDGLPEARYATMEALYQNEDFLTSSLQKHLEATRSALSGVHEQITSIHGKLDAYLHLDHFEVEASFMNLPSSICNVPGFQTTSSYLSENYSAVEVRSILLRHPQLASSIRIPANRMKDATEKLASISGRLSHAVYFVTPQELDALLHDEDCALDMPHPPVLPERWNLIHPQAFQKWRYETERKLQALELQVPSLEKDEQAYNKALDCLRLFYASFPRDTVFAQQSEVQSIQNEMDSREAEIQRIQKKIAIWKQMLPNLRKTIQEKETLAVSLGKQTENLQSAKKLHASVQAQKVKYQEYFEMAKLLEGQDYALKQRIRQNDAKQMGCERSISDIDDKMRKFLDDSVYQDTLKEPAKETDLSLDSLKQEREDLRSRLAELEQSEKSKNIASLSRMIEDAEVRLHSKEGEIVRAEMSANSCGIVIDPQYRKDLFERQYSRMTEDQLPVAIQQIRDEESSCKKAVEQALSKYKEKSGACKERLENYQKVYHQEDPHAQFSSDDPAERKSYVEQRLHELEAEQRQNVAQQKRNTKLFHDYSNLKGLLRKIENEFNADSIQEEPFPDEMKEDAVRMENGIRRIVERYHTLSYQRDDAVSRREAKWKELQAMQQEDVGALFADTFERLQAIHSLEDFRSLASEIRKQANYQKLNFQQRRDELENQMHEVCGFFEKEIERVKRDIHTIQNQTHVDWNGTGVEIYELTLARIPQDRPLYDIIRDYLERCADEDDEKLAEALSLRCVLTAVFGKENFLKISCRMPVDEKDTLVEDFVPWNQTVGQFSGGEEWFRDACLFFAILNYAHLKRHELKKRDWNTRFVIMDNPFASAESTNVTRPVFALAKKLGFQMICLTFRYAPELLSAFPYKYSSELLTTDKKTISNVNFRSMSEMHFAVTSTKKQERSVL